MKSHGMRLEKECWLIRREPRSYSFNGGGKNLSLIGFEDSVYCFCWFYKCRYRVMTLEETQFLDMASEMSFPFSLYVLCVLSCVLKVPRQSICETGGLGRISC